MHYSQVEAATKCLQKAFPLVYWHPGQHYYLHDFDVTPEYDMVYVGRVTSSLLPTTLNEDAAYMLTNEDGKVKAYQRISMGNTSFAREEFKFVRVIPGSNQTMATGYRFQTNPSHYLRDWMVDAYYILKFDDSAQIIDQIGYRTVTYDRWFGQFAFTSLNSDQFIMCGMTHLYGGNNDIRFLKGSFISHTFLYDVSFYNPATKHNFITQVLVSGNFLYARITAKWSDYYPTLVVFNATNGHYIRGRLTSVSGGSYRRIAQSYFDWTTYYHHYIRRREHLFSDMSLSDGMVWVIHTRWSGNYVEVLKFMKDSIDFILGFVCTPQNGGYSIMPHIVAHTDTRAYAVFQDRYHRRTQFCKVFLEPSIKKMFCYHDQNQYDYGDGDTKVRMMNSHVFFLTRNSKLFIPHQSRFENIVHKFDTGFSPNTYNRIALTNINSTIFHSMDITNISNKCEWLTPTSPGLRTNTSIFPYDYLNFIVNPVTTVLSDGYETVYPKMNDNRPDIATGTNATSEPYQIDPAIPLLSNSTVVMAGPNSPTIQIKTDFNHFFHCQGFPKAAIDQFYFQGGGPHTSLSWISLGSMTPTTQNITLYPTNFGGPYDTPVNFKFGMPFQYRSGLPITRVWANVVQIEFRAPIPPTFGTPSSTAVNVTAHHPMSITVPVSDLDVNDTIQIDAVQVGTNLGIPGLVAVVVNNSIANVTYTPPSNADVGLKQIKIRIWDEHDVNNKIELQVNFTVETNLPPNFVSAAGPYTVNECTTESVTLPVILDSLYEDTTSEIKFQMNGSAFPSWVTYDPATRFLNLSPPMTEGGTPYKLYQLKVSTSDEHGYKQDIPIDIRVVDDIPPTFITTPTLPTIMPPSTLNHSLITNFLTANETDLTFKVFSNGTHIPWMTYDRATNKISIPEIKNEYNGTHDLQVEATDNCQSVKSPIFQFTMNPNLPPVVIGNIPSQLESMGTYLNISIPQSGGSQAMFSDPENKIQNMSLGLLIKTGNTNLTAQVPCQLSADNTSILYHPHSNYVGKLQFQLVVYDDFVQQGLFSINVTIDPCFEGCLTCTGLQFFECTYCKDGYFLHQSQCLKEVCPKGTYQQQSNWTCMPCDSKCSACTGPSDTTECTECVQPNFYYQDGCYSVCPPRVYGSATSWNCEPCSLPCHICSGPDSNQCSACRGDLLYVHANGVECVKLVCAKELQYLNATTVTCENCIPNCQLCPNSTHCTKCSYGHVLLNGGSTCTHCNLVTGKFLHETGLCLPKCGDGLRIETEECDDGNRVNGDGCDSICREEPGYNCSSGTCIEQIQPFAEKGQTSDRNTIQFKLSEKCKIVGDLFNIANFNISMTGPNAPYIFKWKFLKIDTSMIQGQNGNLTLIVISVFDIEKSFLGGDQEELVVTLLNTSMIVDLQNNTFKNPFKANPAAKLVDTDGAGATAEAGGYGIMVGFGVSVVTQVLLKLVIQQSAGFLWQLTHAVQIYRYVMLLNLFIPAELDKFSQYFEIASADFEIVDQYLPNPIDYLIVEDEVNIDQTIIGKRFQDAEIDSPYVILEYKTKFCCMLLGVIGIVLMFILLAKIKFFKTFLEYLKQQMFWNYPIRGANELFLEFTFLVFLNILNLRYTSPIQSIASVICIISGVAVVLFPFIQFSIVDYYRPTLNSKQFEDQFGAITEEFRTHQSAFSALYYPLFCFQRITICGILVFLYAYPFLQIVSICVMSTVMVIFIVYERPYLNETQQLLTAIDEFFVIVITVLLSRFLTPQDKSQSLLMTYCIMAVFVFIIGKSFGNIMFTTVKIIQNLYNNHFNKDPTVETAEERRVIRYKQRKLVKILKNNGVKFDEIQALKGAEFTRVEKYEEILDKTEDDVDAENGKASSLSKKGKQKLKAKRLDFILDEKELGLDQIAYQ